MKNLGVNNRKKFNLDLTSSLFMNLDELLKQDISISKRSSRYSMNQVVSVQSLYYINREIRTRGWFPLYNSMGILACGPYFTINIIESDSTKPTRIIPWMTDDLLLLKSVLILDILGVNGRKEFNCVRIPPLYINREIRTRG